ncbi:MAG: hypothetical protein ACLTTH_09965 [Holdemanella porci]
MFNTSELSRKECAKNLGIGDSTLYRMEAKKLKPITTRQHLKVQGI